MILVVVSILFVHESYQSNKKDEQLSQIQEKYSDIVHTLDMKYAENERLMQNIADTESINSELEDQIKEMQLEIDNLLQEFNNFKDEVDQYPISRGEFDKNDINVLYRIVEAEATGQSFDSKVNVTHVIMNRVFSENFPDDIHSVVFQKSQFQPTFDGRFYSVTITEETIEAVNFAMNSLDTTNGALYFMNKSASDTDNISWFEARLEYIMTDDSGHSFYK